MFHHFPATFPQQLLSSVAPAGAFASKGAVAADFFSWSRARLFNLRIWRRIANNLQGTSGILWIFP